jgi:hypothetical protein
MRSKEGFKALFTNKPFYLILIVFSIVGGQTDTMTTTTNQNLRIYGFTQMQAGLANAAPVFLGILTTMIVSPILDRTRSHLLALRILVSCTATAYVALPFIPQLQSLSAVFVVYGFLGAACIASQPAILEIQASWTHPVSPEFSSFVCWSGARVIAAAWTFIVGSALVLDEPQYGQPKGSLSLGLIFMAVATCVCIPAAELTAFGSLRETRLQWSKAVYDQPCFVKLAYIGVGVCARSIAFDLRTMLSFRFSPLSLERALRVFPQAVLR